MRRQNGFTLIELLVVIAIIAILAAIIFPVYAQAKKSAYKSSDLSNMNSLRTALQLYKADNGSFPPALLGYVGPYGNGGSAANAVPPNQVRDALFPKRIESLTVFRPALNRILEGQGGAAAVTTAHWPGLEFKDAGPGQSAQRYGYDKDTYVMRAVQGPNGCTVETNNYYRISGYEVAPRTNEANAPMESHYQLFWTGWTVPGKPCEVDSTTEAGNAEDSPRQLGYTDPPETTVVTWDPFFRDYVGGLPQHQKQDLVLFLGGNARPMDSRNVYDQAWAVTP